MYRYLYHAVWLAVALPMAHAAEPANAPTLSSLPADASARVPATKYDSAFTGYQPYREQGLAPWRTLNDEVSQAGGHIGIFSNAPGIRAKPAPAPAPAPSAHPPEHKN